MHQTSPEGNAASSGIGRSRATLHSTTQMVRRHPWTWPLLFALVLGVVGLLLQRTIARTIKEKMAEELQTILSAEVNALRIWIDARERSVEALASAARVQSSLQQLATVVQQSDQPRRELIDAESVVELRDLLRPICRGYGFIDFVLVSSDGVILAAAGDEALGLKVDPSGPYADRLQRSQRAATPPEREVMPFRDWTGEVYLGRPVMTIGAPVTDSEGNPQGLLAMTMGTQEFSDILHVAQMGQSGETYAFDRQGRMLSRSRFEEQLRAIGLLSDEAAADSTLRVEIRDPGVDLTEGGRSQVARPQQPLTRMARAAIESCEGADLDGYNDYRGVPVIGAWTWLPEYDFGVTTEVDVAEAYREFAVLRRFVWAMFALLAMASLILFVVSSIASRQEAKLRQARLHARQLGQYTLEQKLGEGGMGEVYRGHHAMLRRPTAIKLLHDSRVSEQSIARFEREVQTSSALTHPNTIIIYDYGRTPEGVFYYAMEYLNGTNLNQLVDLYGPQPEGRVISILEQVCGSLAEAHGHGLIHRDIKPANIVLTQCGGISDFVKVVDFGLVKVVDAGREASLTMAGSMTGTPHYMSPEAIQDPEQVDARSDLYSLGAVGFWLLTGRTVFTAEHVFEICTRHIEESPPSPTDVLEHRVSADLESILLQCLAKDKADRPPTAAELRKALLACRAVNEWTAEEASAWWENHEPSRSATTITMAPTQGDTRTRK